MFNLLNDFNKKCGLTASGGACRTGDRGGGRRGPGRGRLFAAVLLQKKYKKTLQMFHSFFFKKMTPLKKMAYQKHSNTHVKCIQTRASNAFKHVCQTHSKTCRKPSIIFLVIEEFFLNPK